MDETQSSNGLAPFLMKTYEMVDDPSSDPIVSWSPSNKSFVVWDPPELAKHLLPKFFKHNNFSSFIRQLNTYGFKKTDPEQWEFANDDFVKGQPHLLKNIYRRKPVHSHSLQNFHGQGTTSSALPEPERKGYNDKIERLKCDKKLLHLELQRHQKEQEGFDKQMQVLTVRLQSVEQSQKHMLSSLARTMRKPGLALNITPQLEMHERKRRFPSETTIDENEMETSQIVIGEEIDSTAMLQVNKQLLEKLESSLILWENVFHDVSRSCQQHNPSIELGESTSCADSPTISYAQLNADVGSKFSGIDMNSEPAAAVVVSVAAASEEKHSATAATVPTGVNDVFWEQFLTENPGSTSSPEVQSEKKDLDGRNVDGKFWWNMKSVNTRSEQMGQLTPAGRT